MVLVLLSVLIVSVAVLRRSPVKTEAQILAMPEKPPSYPSNPLDRWIPMKWGWLWQMRYAIFGYNPSIHVHPTFTDLSETPPDAFNFLLPTRPPLAQTNGTQIWILPPDEYRQLQAKLPFAPGAEELGACRIETGPWVQANIFSGSQVTIDQAVRPFGLSVNIYTRLHGRAVDLTALCTVSKPVTNPPPFEIKDGHSDRVSIQTNLSIAARFVVPESNGIFVLDSSRFQTERKRTAISIAPWVEPYQKPKK